VVVVCAMGIEGGGASWPQAMSSGNVTVHAASAARAWLVFMGEDMPREAVPIKRSIRLRRNLCETSWPQMNVCVTGGAGYIGSHMVRVLRRAGHGVVVVDDLSAGHADALPKDVPLVRADVRDSDVVSRALREHGVEAVLHFASRIQVGESVVKPLLYWRDNLAAGIALVETALAAKVKHFVLSSTAAVYGNPIRTPIDEEHPTVPVNPYG